MKNTSALTISSLRDCARKEDNTAAAFLYSPTVEKDGSKITRGSWQTVCISGKILG